MLNSTRRGNVVWLLAMAMAFLILWQAGALPVAAGVLAVTFFLFTYQFLTQGISVVDIGDRVLDASPFNRPQMTQVAKKASMQASRRPDYDTSRYALKDVGMVIESPQPGGLRLREARMMSMDDEAVRPYINIHAPYQNHPKQTLIRFEITDGSGQPQFIFEMDHWMRPGENLVIPNYRLPLRGNDQLDNTGAWDLQVWVNGGLMAIHDFTVSPSSTVRRRQFGLDGEAQEAVNLDYDAAPVSLDELLSQQRSRSSSGSS